MSNSMYVSFTYAYYYLDPIDFIERLCENKDKPALQCNGKCQLKKVAESSTKDSSSPTFLLDFQRLLLYSEKAPNYSVIKISSKDKMETDYLNLYTFSSIKDWFHPPQL